MSETILPVAPGILSSENPTEVLRLAGVVFHEPVGESGVLFRVTLPFGWVKTCTQKAETRCFSFKLLDDRGRDRATTFEPELEERSYITLSGRFKFALDHERKKQKEVVAHVHGENGIIVYTSRTFTINPGEDYDSQVEKERLAQEEAEDWLDTYYPNWREPGAYWD